jgi:hypothetical protein
VIVTSAHGIASDAVKRPAGFARQPLTERVDSFVTLSLKLKAPRRPKPLGLTG